MEFNEITTEVKNIGLDNTRIDNEGYFEAVVKKDSVGKVAQVLEGILGKPAWPAKCKLSKETNKMLKNYGGLRKGQTLFFLSKGGISLFAMLWPWRDGERITVKIGKC